MKVTIKNTYSSLRRCGIYLGFICFALSAQVCLGQTSEQQESRIDFGNTYIQGQSIKSGAVYLTNRRKSALTSLLKTRQDYRYEILKDFYGLDLPIRPTPEPDAAQDAATTP